MAQLDRAPVAQFKLPKFRVAWKKANIPEARWILGAFGFYHRETPRRYWFVFSVRGLLAWACGLAFIAYFAGAGALYFFWNRNEHSKLAYADLVLPTRWQDARHKRGDALIKQGLQELRAGRGASSIMLLNHGVRLSPGNSEGRTILANIYIRIGHAHRAFQLLTSGLNHGTQPRSYLDALFKLAQSLEDYESIVQLSDRLAIKASDSDKRWLLAQKATALEKLKRYEELDALRESIRQSPIFAVESAWARSQAARGSATSALEEVEKDPTRFGLPSDRYPLQVSLLEATGRDADAEALVNTWQKQEPGSFVAKLEKILLHSRRGQADAFEETVDDYILFFASQPGSVVLLFKKLSDLDDSRWIRTAWRVAERSGINRLDIRVLYVQNLIATGALAEAEIEFQKTRAAIAAAKISLNEWENGTHYLIQVLRGDSPSNRAQLMAFCTKTKLSPEGYRFILRSLHRAKIHDLGREIAVFAANRFPAFQSPIPASALEDEANALLAKASLETTAEPELKTEFSAQLELRALKADITAKRWADAAPRIRRLERAGFEKLATDVRLARIEMHGETREQAELVGALRLYFRGNNTPNQLHRFATNWSEDPNLQDSTLTLLREIIIAFPQAKWAVDMRKKIEGDLLVAPVESELKNN